MELLGLGKALRSVESYREFRDEWGIFGGGDLGIGRSWGQKRDLRGGKRKLGGGEAIFLFAVYECVPKGGRAIKYPSGSRVSSHQ